MHGDHSSGFSALQGQLRSEVELELAMGRLSLPVSPPPALDPYLPPRRRLRSGGRRRGCRIVGGSGELERVFTGAQLAGMAAAHRAFELGPAQCSVVRHGSTPLDVGSVVDLTDDSEYAS